MINRNQLQILREIDRLGSMTAASESLNLTQSALSHAIKKLEHDSGTQIWTKEGRNLVLTEVGIYLLNEAKRLLPQLERIDETLEQFSEGELGTLRIGMECHPCYKWILKNVESFLQNNPGMDVDVKQEFQFGGIAALLNYDIDILVTPDPLKNKGIDYFPVFAYEQVLVCHKKHPLGKQNFIKPSDLSEQVLYAYPVEVDRLDIYKMFLSPAGCSPKKHKVTESTEMMLQLVAANRGVAALPKWLVDEYKKDFPLKTVRLGKSGVQKEIHLGVRAKEESNKAVESFLSMLNK